MRLGAIATAFVLAGIWTSSCHTSRHIVKVTPQPLEQVLDSLHQRAIDYTYFTGKAKIRFNGEESKMGGRSNILMIRDSIILLTFKKMSIEAARTLIRPDSTWVLYRFDDLYELGETRDFLDDYKIYMTFRDLQDLLIGNLPIPEIDDVVRFQSDDYHSFSFNHQGDKYEYLINEDYSIYRILIKDTFARELVITFSDYNDDQFANKKELIITIPQEGRSTFSIKFSKTEFDKPKSIKFSIPNHYTRLP